MKIIEVNCETGEEVLREATKAEKDEAKARLEKLAEIEAEAEAKAAQRQAILDRLGLTADEAKLLLG
jgi:hypothetical protein